MKNKRWQAHYFSEDENSDSSFEDGSEDFDSLAKCLSNAREVLKKNEDWKAVIIELGDVMELTSETKIKIKVKKL